MKFSGLYNSWPLYEMNYDRIYGKLRHLLKPWGHYIKMEDVEKIKKLEAAVFPDTMVGYSKVSSLKEFLGKMRCDDVAQIDYVIEDDFLFLAVFHYNCIYVRDMGVTTKNASRVFSFFKEKIEEYYNTGKPVFIEAREKTAYKLLKYYERKGFFDIIEDVEKLNAGEIFHRLKLVRKS